MKNLFLISLMIFTLNSFSQNQTWSGTKVLNTNNPNPFKLSNVPQNNANTKILSIDNNGKPAWIDKSTISPNFQSVLNSGNTSTTTGSPHFYLITGTQSSQYFAGGFISGNSSNGNNLSINNIGFNNYNNDGRFAKLDFINGLTLKTTVGGSPLANVKIKTDLVSNEITLQAPNNSGTLLVDAPSDGQKYLRQNGVWTVNSSSSTTLPFSVYTLNQNSTNSPTLITHYNSQITQTIPQLGRNSVGQYYFRIPNDWIISTYSSRVVVNIHEIQGSGNYPDYFFNRRIHFILNSNGLGSLDINFLVTDQNNIPVDLGGFFKFSITILP